MRDGDAREVPEGARSRCEGPALGVANSVFADRAYDPMATIEYAARRGLAAVQIYLSLRDDEALAARAGARACRLGLEPLCHWPGLLTDGQVDDEGLLARTRAFFAGWSGPRRVVVHFDGRRTRREAVLCLDRLARRGYVPALENTFYDADPVRSARCLEDLVAVLTRCGVDGIPCRAVIDVPRFWCSANGPVEEALPRLERLARAAAEAGIGSILHVIDARDAAQERGTWVSMGAGTLPWGDIGGCLARAGIAPETIIMEFETIEHADGSVAFLEQWTSRHFPRPAAGSGPAPRAS